MSYGVTMNTTPEIELPGDNYLQDLGSYAGLEFLETIEADNQSVLYNMVAWSGMDGEDPDPFSPDEVLTEVEKVLALLETDPAAAQFDNVFSKADFTECLQELRKNLIAAQSAGVTQVELIYA